MSSLWIAAALFSSVAVAGCGTSGNARNPQQNQPSAASMPSLLADTAPKAPEFEDVTIPAGTSLPLTMTTTISSKSTQVEAPVSAQLTNAVMINGETVIPAGSTLSGTVTDVERSGRVEGRAHMAFVFNQIRMRGEPMDLNTNPLTFEANAMKTKAVEKDAVRIVFATHGEDVTVNEGTNITATLAQPITVRIPIR